jgi:acylphosphatase
LKPGATHAPRADEQRAIRCIVAGRVQGVYSRAATAERAAELGLGGWVKNLPDGRVEAVASGSLDALAELAAWLWQGPPAARVTSVQVEEWTEAVPDRFDVRG